MRSEGFSTTWPILFSNTFATVGEFQQLLQSFVSIRNMIVPLPKSQTRKSIRKQNRPSCRKTFRPRGLLAFSSSEAALLLVSTKRTKRSKKKRTKRSAASGDENGPARSSELYSWVARDVIIDPPKLLSLSGMRGDKFMCV